MRKFNKKIVFLNEDEMKMVLKKWFYFVRRTMN